MPECPLCGAEIDHFIEYMESWAGTKYTGKPTNQKYEDMIVDIIPIEGLTYDCPKCGETVFESLCDAKEFLNQK